jgi:hypothetical protein
MWRRLACRWLPMYRSRLLLLWLSTLTKVGNSRSPWNSGNHLWSVYVILIFCNADTIIGPSNSLWILYVPNPTFLLSFVSHLPIHVPSSQELFAYFIFSVLPSTPYFLTAPWTSVVLKEFKLCLRSAIQQACSLHFGDIKCSCPLFLVDFHPYSQGTQG